MSESKWKPTHRMLIKASKGHGYDIIAIDVVSGTFKKTQVGQEETLIRVNKGIYGESINYYDRVWSEKNRPLSSKDAVELGIKFNKLRKTKDWEPIDFYRLEKEYAKSLN